MKQRKIFAKPYGNTIAGLVLMALCVGVLYALMTLARPVTSFFIISEFDRNLKVALDPLYKNPEEEHTPWSEITVSTEEYLDRAEQVCMRYVEKGDISHYNRDDEEGRILVDFKCAVSYVIEAPNGEPTDGLTEFEKMKRQTD